MADGDLQFQRDEDGVSYGPAMAPEPPAEISEHDVNLAQYLAPSTLSSLSTTLTEAVSFDEDGRSGIEDMAEVIHDLLGLAPVEEGEDDSGIDDTSSSTLMLTALLRFQAKALSVLLPSDDMAVRTEPAIDLDQIEDEDQRDAMREEITKAERRVQEFYTDYLFHKLPSYEEDTDLILHDMGLMGCGIRKIVTDTTRKATPVMPEYCAPGSLVISYNTKNFRVGRVAHKIDMETGDLIRRIRSGVYRPVTLVDHGAPDTSPITEASDRMFGVEAAHYQQSETHRLLEVYTSLILDADRHPDSLPRPYIVTIHAATQEIVAVQRNWDKADPDETPLEHFVAYLYHPGKNSVTGVGLGQILMQTTHAMRKAQRAMLAAGYLQNHPSGFKLGSMSIRDGNEKIRYGEFMDVDSPTGDINKAIMLHPFQGPSPGLMALSERMEAAGRELGGTASIDFAALMKSGVAAGPAMAAFEESTEFQTSVHRRLYKAQRKEMELIHDRLITILSGRAIPYKDDKVLQPNDLRSVKVLPYMKPGQASRQKVIMEAQAVWDMAQANPDVLNKRRAAENFIRALGSPEADELILPAPEDQEIMPADPVTEYTLLLTGQPLKAGMMQNHQAHIDAHTAQMKMLQVSSLPVDQGDAMSAQLAAHIAEHMGLQMLVEATSRVGISPDQLGPDIPPQLEAQIAPLLAQAIVQIEQERRPPDGGGEKLAVQEMKERGATEREMLKSQARMTEAELKLRHDRENAERKHQQAVEIQELKDRAAMEREIEDNTAAIRIARMKQSGKSATAGTDASA